LKQSVAAEGNPFPEIFLRQIAAFENFPRFHLHFAQRRLPVQARPLVEQAVVKDESLREGAGIVRVGVDDLVSVNRGC
jgi:hypothetical protein